MTPTLGAMGGLQPDTPPPPQDFSERYVQTGRGQLSGHSVQSFLQGGHTIRAHCNHTIQYDPSAGLRPPRVQQVRASTITASYDPASEQLRFQLRAALRAGNEGVPGWARRCQHPLLASARVTSRQ